MDDFNPYAAPEAEVSRTRVAGEEDEGRGVWCDGDVLVMAKIARLPSRCVKCNAPSTHRLKRSLRWHNPWLFWMFLFPGWIFYLIVALIVSKKAKIELPLCDQHFARRRNGIWIGLAVVLAGVGLIFFGAITEIGYSEVSILAGFVMILCGLIFLLVRERVVPTKKIDNTHVWLKKVSPLYLAELIPLPYSDHWQKEKVADIRWDEI